MLRGPDRTKLPVATKQLATWLLLELNYKTAGNLAPAGTDLQNIWQPGYCFFVVSGNLVLSGPLNTMQHKIRHVILGVKS